MRVALVLIFLVTAMLAACGGEETGGTEGDPASTVSRQESSRGPTTSEAELRTVIINASGGEEVEVRVEIADDSAEQAQGLMNRTALGEDRGMLFVFGNESTRAFWMKNTLIPLSIAYIDSEGRIVDIQKMEPAGRDQTGSDAELPRYVSAEPAKYALEVNQGFFEEHGVEVGDTAELPV